MDAVLTVATSLEAINSLFACANPDTLSAESAVLEQPVDV
jgi:hypothetical protein